MVKKRIMNKFLFVKERKKWGNLTFDFLYLVKRVIVENVQQHILHGISLWNVFVAADVMYLI